MEKAFVRAAWKCKHSCNQTVTHNLFINANKSKLFAEFLTNTCIYVNVVFIFEATRNPNISLF